QKITGLGTTLYAAISDSSGYGGVAISDDRGQSFTLRDEGNGLPYPNVEDVAVASEGGNTYVYAATFWGLGVSTDGGATFTPKTVNPGAGGNVDCVWASGATVWACAGSTLNLSINSGTSFTQKLGGTSGGVAVAVSGGNVYLATWSGLWVSNDGGANFTVKGVADGLASDLVYDVAVDGSGRVLAATNNGLSKSVNSGASFTDAATPPIYAYGVFAQGSTWYAAGFSGLSISQDGGATWATRGVADGIVATAYDAWYMP
ncbi:MAG TPA: hypothetical protein VFI16_13045, partial [Anaeromyxobacteraceae bacterium]|nr:hypothetical protein [Anaeromyxobacteraceae bacterium]